MEVSKVDVLAWINALRSGDYKQGKGALQTVHGHCCLGVACEIFIPKAVQTRHQETKRLTGSMPGSQYASPRWLADIDRDFKDKTGLWLASVNDGYLLNSAGRPMAANGSSLAANADKTIKHTFEEIADLLQAVYIEGVLND